jgi:hypothetical protein
MDAEPCCFLRVGLPADHQRRGEVEGRVAPVFEQPALEVREVLQGNAWRAYSSAASPSPRRTKVLARADMAVPGV